MSEHFTRSTVAATAWCAKCQKHTLHRVDDRRIGPCLACIEKLDRLYEEHAEFERQLKQQGFKWA